MSSVSRFSVSVPSDLLKKFDGRVEQHGYPTRSKPSADLMRAGLVEQEWRSGREVAAVVILVYDHHSRDLSRRLMRIQHDHVGLKISSQHIHLDHDNCLEIVVVRGKPGRVEELANKLKAVKGVKYATLAAASTGRDL